LHDVLARVYLAKLCHSISRARVLDGKCSLFLYLCMNQDEHSAIPEGMHWIVDLTKYLHREAWHKVTVQFPPLSTSFGSKWQSLFWGYTLCSGKSGQHRKVAMMFIKLSFYLLCFCTSDGVICCVVNYQLSRLAALRTELADGFG
jgi:hypothetical protein